MIYNDNIPVEPHKCLSIIGIEGYETYKIDDNTIGVRPKWIDSKIIPARKDISIIIISRFYKEPDVVRWDEYCSRGETTIFQNNCGYNTKEEDILYWMPFPSLPEIINKV